MWFAKGKRAYGRVIPSRQRYWWSSQQIGVISLIAAWTSAAWNIHRAGGAALAAAAQSSCGRRIPAMSPR